MVMWLVVDPLLRRFRRHGYSNWRQEKLARLRTSRHAAVAHVWRWHRPFRDLANWRMFVPQSQLMSKVLMIDREGRVARKGRRMGHRMDHLRPGLRRQMRSSPKRRPADKERIEVRTGAHNNTRISHSRRPCQRYGPSRMNPARSKDAGQITSRH